jgi:hypothetical protein
VYKILNLLPGSKFGRGKEGRRDGWEGGVMRAGKGSDSNSIENRRI